MAPENARAPQRRPPPPPAGQELGEGLPLPAGAVPDPGGVPEPAGGVSVAGGGSLYHERQRLELCALHALNNLLQRPWLSREGAERICRELSPNSRLNPHRSPLGTGNYDVNVVMAALATRGLAAVWWDKRRPLERLCLSPVLGLLLNVPSPVTFGGWSLPLRRPHWVGVRQWGGTFYNLDSKLERPLPIGGEEQLRTFLGSLLSPRGPSELFLVVPRDVEAAGTWLRPE